jgi:hypothetical protein
MNRRHSAKPRGPEQSAGLFGGGADQAPARGARGARGALEHRGDQEPSVVTLAEGLSAGGDVASVGKAG